MQNNESTDRDRTIAEIAEHYAAILRLIGEDCSREGLEDTPERAAKALYYITRGYRQNIDDVIHGALFEAPSSDLVIVKDIEFYSLCEHHILPFFGTVSVGYIPGTHIVGLSKIARLVDVFSRRLQVQERFSRELCDILTEKLDARGVMVWCQARHLCMQMRGVEKQNASTVSVATSGIFTEDAELRHQFLASLSK
ncbi:MAG: GTP cyclohydrolase I FolE [Bacteroides sp.]|nr:GTP cyclohydrolase I FolE [Bacteroides sp.]MCM1413438.1 GTP cyclohydrolase I FolE [Bacteroides sp.]MCM1471351.1 GTP cyclohydrolase I FolE [Bacteroides sp.]